MKIRCFGWSHLFLNAVNQAEGMDGMKKTTNLKFWNRVAKWYTPMQEKSNKSLYERLCKLVIPYIDTEHKILELGCGTGQLTGPLSRRGGEWIATDFSERMIAEGKKRSKWKNVKFEVADATELRYEDDVFDLVLIANTLHIMPEPQKALREIRRVLKPDGLLIAPTFVYDGHINRLRIWVMERIGFRTFYKWNHMEYLIFLEENGFDVIEDQLLPGELLSESLAVCRVRTAGHDTEG